MLSNTLKLNFCYLKIIHILHPGYHPKIRGDIPKNNKRKSMSHEIIQLIITKMKIEIKNKSRRYDTNRNRSRPGYK